MKFLSYASAALVAMSTVLAQDDDNDQSLCDKYTTALLMENNATNQATVITLVVNTALCASLFSFRFFFPTLTLCILFLLVSATTPTPSRPKTT